MEMKYRTVFTPEGGKWNVEVPSVKGCHTWGRSLKEARRNAVDAIATCAIRDGATDAAADRIARDAELVEEFRFAVQVGRRLTEARLARAAAEEAERQAAAATASAVISLTDAGLSFRDAGLLLGLSHQRIHQIKEMVEPVDDDRSTARKPRSKTKTAARTPPTRAKRSATSAARRHRRASIEA